MVLSEPILDGLLALDMQPVGAVSGRGQDGISPYLGDRGEGIHIVGGVGKPAVEKIGRSDPDLILVDGTPLKRDPGVVFSLRKVAPVVNTGKPGGDWKENFRLIADAVNKRDEGKQVLERYKKRTNEVKSKLSQNFSQDTFSVVRWQDNNASLILGELPAVIALTDLGLQRP